MSEEIAFRIYREMIHAGYESVEITRPGAMSCAVVGTSPSGVDECHESLESWRQGRFASDV